jgi:hypothetical protein
MNQNAIHLLEQNRPKIDWYMFSVNPNIFTYDNDDLHEQFVKLTILSNKF